MSETRVVIVGGGYGGINLAKALDEEFDVVLVDPKEAFSHNVAALRGLVDPTWLPNIFFPYRGLLERGEFVQERAVAVEPGRVTLESGRAIEGDYVVLATGSSYPFPAKVDSIGVADAHARYEAAHAALVGAGRVMLLGAGPVGLELAGEIAAVWPEKQVTLVDLADDILVGPFKQELRDELRRQLDERGIELVLGSPLVSLPPTEPGEAGTFTVETADGRAITADLWYQAFGVTPVTDYLTGDLQAARRDDGFIDVGPTLQVAGHDNVFALGDASSIDSNMAGRAGRQAQLVAENIRAHLAGAALQDYEPLPPVILIPLGPNGGAGQLPGNDEISGPDVAAQLKGSHMMVENYAALFTAANTPAGGE